MPHAGAPKALREAFEGAAERAAASQAEPSEPQQPLPARQKAAAATFLGRKEAPAPPPPAKQQPRPAAGTAAEPKLTKAAARGAKRTSDAVGYGEETQTEYVAIPPSAKRAKRDALTEHQRETAARQRQGA